jgi:predicted permease
VVSSLRQTGHSATEVQLSGLAADEARDPQIMVAGFVVLGVCSIGFGIALRRALAPRAAGAWLVIAAGTAAVAAGVFRRDHLLLVGPGLTGESWHNQVHDVVSGVAYGAMLAAPLVLARRWSGDPDWTVLSRPVRVLVLVSAAALALFASQIAAPYNGVVQRIAVTLPLTAEILIAGRMLTWPLSGSAAGPGVTPSPGAPAGRRLR